MRYVLAMILCLLTATVAAAQCRQALALGLDVSGSVDSAEYRIQFDGLASALLDPEVQEALLAPGLPPVSLAIFEWSGVGTQRLLVGWQAITSQADILTIAAGLRDMGRQGGETSTGISAAIAFGAALLAQKPDCWKRTLDLSGDGYANAGTHPRQMPHPAGITVNGLVIGAQREGLRDTAAHWQAQLERLAEYYRAYVVSGPDAFVEMAGGFEDFEAAMIRKLKRELQGLTVSQMDTSELTKTQPRQPGGRPPRGQ
ncbi:DUF1194 domain-containing protein [Shimia biformata]|uniref:DUF1194 domain-containing protein n=1 Tax=Shimia biformata TaxID=1294299 RepID=UPI00194EA723|nr:DUF1194 domain-containing protein [Shimia biformata]